MPLIIVSAIFTKLTKSSVDPDQADRVLTPFAEQLFNQLDSLKFLAHIGPEGYPAIIPVIQCQAAGIRRLAFSPIAFNNELKQIHAGEQVAVFCLTMGMEDVLIRGTFQGYRRKWGLKLGTIDIEWVYNSMPPAHGQIYPPVELKAVIDF